MISNEKQLRLIQIYFFVCEAYQACKHDVQRFSNNQRQNFTDEEVLTLYLFAGAEQQCRHVRQAYDFAVGYLRGWFPALPSYQQYSYRLNLLHPILRGMVERIMTDYIPAQAQPEVLLVDSLPIVTCKGRNRHAKVAREVVTKGYCSTKNMHYYGCKLHVLGRRCQGTLPFPHQLYVSSASEHDLTVFKEAWGDSLYGVQVFADKAYVHADYFEARQKLPQQLELWTPIKEVKGTPECLRQRDRAYKNLYGGAVSKVRQPIESLFNWIIEKSNIQCAQKVRSLAGLWCHIFGKLAIAMLHYVFNS
jgi:hypothetical protein